MVPGLQMVLIPILLFLGVFIEYGEGGNSLSSSHIVVQDTVVPTYGIQGKHAVLSCFYSPLHGIYAVKWYKNGMEFYSYLPGRPHPITIHPLEGIHVDVSRSSSQSVYLLNLSLATTGRFRCEVSGEAPIFATDSKYGDMLVVVVPDQGPIIHGAKTRYVPGEEVQLNCTAENTKPPTNLTWYINQKLVPETYITRYPIVNTSQDYEYLHTSTVGLKYRINRTDFGAETNEIRIKCTASIYDAYYKVSEVSAEKIRRFRKKTEEITPDPVSEDEKNDFGFLSSGVNNPLGFLLYPGTPCSPCIPCIPCINVSCLIAYLLFSCVSFHL
ncbi:cell adhesion molecule 1 [Eurytemora carolleeae]|uniref:cell adhesion molecule 1 n=1 Tax=Eurytemora carolleeae TaxID=1294199 RepID=UPI000C75977B|nr:cell adhesion molecule 1 [Eurytemora carolleeae]|eukprot:XP_023321773.1 cell adhesion molecule 1-like [Eurytemora affinis]